LAFIVALQHLLPRQAATLVLRDVLGFSTAEVAGMLDSSETAIKARCSELAGPWTTPERPQDGRVHRLRAQPGSGTSRAASPTRSPLTTSTASSLC